MAESTKLGRSSKDDDTKCGEASEVCLVEDQEEGVDRRRAFDVPISDFPALPKRDSRYWTEPFIITALVGANVVFLVLMTMGGAGAIENETLATGLLVSIYSLAGIAALCILILLFGRQPDEVRRSQRTCYPIPEKVARMLVESPKQDLVPGLSNIPGPEGSLTMGTYCVRCLVWRPPSMHHDSTHHCSVCQRCVTGFDHHCGVIGRCITKRNMPAFVTLIAMLPAGVVVAVGSMVLGSAQDRMTLL